MKTDVNSFCIESSCEYFRSAENIFRELGPESSQLVDEHLSVKHIML